MRLGWMSVCVWLGAWTGLLLCPGLASAQWAGLVDVSAAQSTDRFPFFGFNPEAGGNENYYDGDLGDFDGDGLPDRLLGARYGLLFNTGDAFMVPVRRDVGHLLRGDPGASGWGEDGMALIDVDGDGDLDALSGGNGEPLSCQINNQWRWRVLWSERGHSALNIVPTDLERDGDVDLLVAHAFCAQSACGGPADFDVMVNDGSGNFAEQSSARGLARANGEFVSGVVSGDIDNDGDFDVLTMRGTSATKHIQVGLNDGTGNFTTSIVDIPAPGSGFAQGFNLADINDDGNLDIVAGRGGMPYAGGHPTISHVLAFGDGAGGFTDVSATHFDAAGFTGVLLGGNAAVADIDYDGDIDFIAVEKAADYRMTTDHRVHVFENDGTGRLVYSAAHSMAFPGRSSGLGFDVDIADLDGDGDYDLWAGFGSDVVHLLMNQHVDPSGLPADQPRGLRVVATDAGGVTLGWSHPPFASSVRRYRVYRSLADRLHRRDRELLHVVGQSRHLDRDFYGTIDRHTTTAMLGDADVAIDPGTGEVRFTDRTAVPGVVYFYSVTHVGPEHSESAPTPEVPAMLATSGGADTTGPQLSIVSPTTQSWGRSPRIVVAYGDEDSGVDLSSLRVSFDTPLGPLAADADLVPQAYRHDLNTFVAYLAPPHELPADSLVTLNVQIADNAGNVSSDSVQFFVNILPSFRSSPMLPSASFTASPTSGMAPVDIAFDASASDDPDGLIMRWEWYFGDGETAIGRRVTHRFAFGGTYDVTLLVRDNEGGVAVSTQSLTLDGAPPTDAGPPNLDAGVAPGDGGGCVPNCDRRSCGPDGCGGECGACAADETCGPEAQCLCASGEVSCGGVCGVDVDRDPDHCGRCGNICGAGETCESGACVGPESDGDGCGCSAPGRAGRGPLAAVGLLLVGLLLRRRN